MMRPGLAGGDEPCDQRAKGERRVDRRQGMPLKRRLQEEALQATFHRLEMPLRFLLYATAPGREPSSVEEYQGIVNLWRQGLEAEARLMPDNFTGAVRCYEPAMDDAYTIKGRCTPGQQLRITVPAWRLHGEVVVRGEAEPCES